MTDAGRNPAGDGTPPSATTIVPKISLHAFCETEECATVIQQAADDRRMSKANVKILMGGAQAAIDAFQSAPTPNLIILETLSDRATLIMQLDALAEYCDQDTKVVVIGPENDIALYRLLISRGVSDYIVAPIGAIEFISKIYDLYGTPGGGALGRVIGVIGARGGVGASTIAHNLAWSISTSLELHTVVVDLDLAFGTVGLDFNQDPAQGVADAIFSPDRLDENFIDKLLTKCGKTLSILAAPVALERTYDMTEFSVDPTVDILRATAPCVVLDIPHCWTAWARRAILNCDEIIIVVSPDLTCLRNAKAIADAMKASRVHDRPPIVLFNFVGIPRRPEIPRAELATAFDVPEFGAITFDPKLFGNAANNGQMLAEIEPKSETVATIERLGRTVMGKIVQAEEKKTFMSNIMASLTKRT